MGIYNSLEEKWYKVLEKVDSKVRVFWLVDRVDSVIPSFLLFLLVLLLIVIIIGAVSFNFGDALFPGEYDATFVLKSSTGEVIRDSVVQIKIIENGKVVEELTRRTDATGKITLSGLKKGQEVNINANLTKGTIDTTITIDAPNFFQEIKLKAPAPTPIDRRIITRNQLGMTIDEPVEMIFYCENSAVTPTPASATTINGSTTVTEPLNCVKLYAKITDSEYEQKTYHINSKSYEMRLEPYTPPEVSLRIKLRYNDFPVSDASFNITLSGQESYTQIANSSEAKIDILPGSYFMSISDPNGKYATTSKQITVTEDRDEYVNVTKEIQTRISVTVVDEATSLPIEGAIVSLKRNGREIQKDNTDEDGAISFALIDTGSFTINAKKVGEVGVGYFSKEVTLTGASGDIDTEIELEAITTTNAGRTTVLVTDQDDEPVQGAKVMLKYANDDTLVELNQQNNYGITDVNGIVTLLAGNVEGKIYASMLKYPFSGESGSKTISIDQDNEFEIQVDIGYTDIRIYVKDQTGEDVDGEAELFEMNNEGISGLISIENGEGGARIKAGRTVYLAIRSNEHETFFSEPVMLWPSTSHTYNIEMQTEINEPEIEFDGIFNEQDNIVRTMKAGNEYYALFTIQSDESYNELMFNFRAGLEKLLENDYIEIDTVEAAMISSEIRGTSYNPEEGYSYDSENTTASLAKWASVYWNPTNIGTRRVKVNFRIKSSTPSNKKMQFFWKARFDGTRKPNSTETEDLYADAYASDIYFIGEESVCDTAFCVISEWLYDEKDELYLPSPYVIRQVFDYTYHYQIVNNSSKDFGTETTKIVLGIENLSQDGKGLKIKSYEITGPNLNQTGGELTSLSGLELPDFERNSAIDITLQLEGTAPGSGAIETELKSEGEILFIEQEGFSVSEEEQMSVSIDPTFIPAMLDTELTVTVTDSTGEPVNEATVKVYARQPGFTKYVVYESPTSRFGKALVYSGAHFTGTEVTIEVSKEEYSKATFQVSVSDAVVIANPGSLAVTLNTIDPREATKSVEFGNATGKTLVVNAITTATDFEGVINESALQSYFDQIVGTEIAPNDTEELDLLRIKLDASLASDTMIEPIDITGDLIISFRVKGTGIIYDSTIPLSLYVSSEANPAAKCLLLTDATQTKTTERGKVYFYFELTNACQTENGADITIDTIFAKLNSSDIKGSAEISLQSYNSTNGGRTAIDGLEREVYANIAEADKLAGTLAYSPSTEAVGETINITATLNGKFQDQTISTDPTTLNFTVNVINLQDCMTIDEPTGTVDYDSEATITVDATRCLGQKIEVTLCKDDSGCSGDDASGTVSLSNRDFVLENSSETISVYSPTYPGAYGVSVWARVKGTSSYSYIGEAVAKFNEDDDDYFELSKFDYYLVGDGSTDIAVLENDLLKQNVKIKADYCVWGEEVEEATISEYLAAASLGVTIGAQIGGAFDSDGKGKKVTEKTEDQSDMDADTRVDAAQTTKNINDTADSPPGIEDYTIRPTDGKNYDVTAIDVGNGTYQFILSDPSTPKDTISTVGSVSIDSRTGGITLSDMPSGFIIDKSYGGVTSGNGNAWNTTYSRGYDSIGTPVANSQSVTYSSGFSTHTFRNTDISGSALSAGNAIARTENSFWGRSFIGWNDTTTTMSKQTKTPKISFSPQPTYSQIYFPGTKVYDTTIDTSLPKLGLVKLGTGIGSIVGLAAGIAAVYFSQDECEDLFLTKTSTDYVINLQGETITVESADGSANETRVVPSDAGDLSLTLGGISKAWDFTDAELSSSESVGIKFTNSGLNSTTAKYGTFKVNATKHMHGYDPINGTSDDDYDIKCNNSNFGEYWIGSEADAGSCTGISTGTYSQTYHLRFETGEQTDSGAYINKSGSCTNGVLTGSTGSGALPKVKMEWDWDSIEEDTCDYGNSDYIYCDATQFTISLVKKIARINEFFRVNRSHGCPENPVISDLEEEMEIINETTGAVPNGYIGVTDIDVSVIDDVATATVTIENLTGGEYTSYLGFSWVGNGDSTNDQYEWDIPSGESYLQFTASTPEWDGIYYFHASMSGDKGNRRTISRAFQNANSNNDCWAPRTTRNYGGIPSIYYYLIDSESEFTPTTNITSYSDLYDYLSFKSYLMKDGYSDDFFNDFANYYTTTLQLANMSQDEIDTINYLNTSNFEIVKRFTNEIDMAAGLYDVKIYADFGDEDFTLINDGETDIETSLLLIKTPSVDSPFYDMPIDGVLGEDDGRQGYGSSYDNANGEISFNDSVSLVVNASTMESVSSNTVSDVTTNVEYNFEKINSSVGSRGQIAKITQSGTDIEIEMTPGYATPVIGKYDLSSGTSGQFKFRVEKSNQPVNAGGNLNYWDGAAKSIDFTGSYAVEVYDGTADSRIDGTDYGFEWKDIIQNGTLYLKTFFYTPTDNIYALVAETGSFWTPDEEFSQVIQLRGIKGMNYNSQANNSKIETIQDLFDFVDNGDICVSNDGQTTSFWWNEYILANTLGLVDSQYDKEVALAGSS